MAEEDDDDYGRPAGGRSFWTGTITFGLVSVPVALYAATRTRGVALKMISEEGSAIQRRYVCSKDGAELEPDDIVRGYEIEKGKFVIVTDEELEAIEPRKTREIDLQLFVDINEIDPMYFEKAYFLTPSGGSNKAYRLLAEVMERSGRAGIATFVMRAKEYLVAIISENGILRAETLRFHDEIRKPEDVGLPAAAKAKPADVKKFEAAIAKQSGKVDFHDFLDDYAKRLERLVAQKQKQHRDIVSVSVEESEDEGGAEVVDLLSVLTASLRGTRPAAKAAPKAAARKPAAAKRATAAKKSPAKRPAATRTAAKGSASAKKSAASTRKPARKAASSKPAKKKSAR
jgi:DNA end-binding protein Ku